MREIVFFSIVLAVVAGLHSYLGRRLFGRRSGLERWRVLGGSGLALSALLMLIAFVGGRFLPRSSTLLTVQYLGYLCMGLVLVLFPLTLARDLSLGGWRALRALLYIRMREGPPVDPARRTFLRQVSSLGVLGSSSALATAGVIEAREVAEVRRVAIPFAGLHPDLVNLRIVQITDLHVGPILGRAWLDEVVTTVNQRKPDLIAVTGDLVDGYVPDLRDEVGAIRRLRAPLGVFFVTGNHEYYWDAEAWVAEVQRLGLTVLLNEHRVLDVGAAKLLVAGVTDVSAGALLPAHASDPARALAGAPAVDLKLLLAHQPKSIGAAKKLGYDLQLSGHTHGGQFFPWNLVIGLFQPLLAGLGRFQDTWLYVSRGTGTWGPPLRTGVPSEISVIELARDESA